MYLGKIFHLLTHQQWYCESTKLGLQITPVMRQRAIHTFMFNIKIANMKLNCHCLLQTEWCR